ncbi:MAG: response regulator, partial [Mesorhizobium sp.]
PAVILLSTRNGTPDSLGLSSVVDAVVTKPITPERLQPVIDRLVGRG